MIDKKFIGREYPPASYEIGKEKVREYARAVGDLNPLYLDDDAAKKSKYGGPIAPPMFTVVFARDAVARVVMDPDLSLNLMMLVHGEQEFEFKEVLRPGDVITTRAKIADVYRKEKEGKAPLDFWVVETTSSNQKNKEVVKGRWTFVIRGG